MQPGIAIGDRGIGSSGDAHLPWVLGYATLRRHNVIGASAVGRLHLRGGATRDDAFAIRSSGPWLAVAISDGVGSRPMSRFGASYVVEVLSSYLMQHTRKFNSDAASVEHVENDMNSGLSDTHQSVSHLTASLERWSLDNPQFDASAVEPESNSEMHSALTVGWGHRSSWQGNTTAESLYDLKSDSDPILHEDLEIMMIDAFEKTSLGLTEHARKLGLGVKELGCTALALLLNLDDEYGIAGQVGDGAVLATTLSGEVQHVLERSATSSIQEAETLEHSDFRERLKMQKIARRAHDPVRTLYLMTDGLADDLLYSNSEKLQDWVTKVDRNLTAPVPLSQIASGMLNWLATYEVPASWDDRTLVAVVKK